MLSLSNGPARPSKKISTCLERSIKDGGLPNGDLLVSISKT